MQKNLAALLVVILLSSLCKAAIHQDQDRVHPLDFHQKSQMPNPKTLIVASNQEEYEALNADLDKRKNCYSSNDPVGAIVHQHTVVLATPIPKTTASSAATKAAELEKQKLKEENAELDVQAADLRADSTSLEKKQTEINEFGKALSCMSFTKEDETSSFIRAMGKVMQSIKFPQHGHIEYNKQPILDLFSEQNKHISKLQEQLEMARKDLLSQRLRNKDAKKLHETKSNSIFSKRSLLPFFTGVAITSGGFAALYFTYLKNK
ncbi:MAG TPA: hypothetical protein VHO47_03015 [Candidatus Babeliales bacterium]|nr:hypothetical protein [Candidatus Babeliales bacterium]